MSKPIRRIQFTGTRVSEDQEFLLREWLVTNGLGGYASGTIAGVQTRRYHGLLVASLPSPFGRVSMLSGLTELVRLGSGETILFGGTERAGGSLEFYGSEYLEEFRLEMGLPVWIYRHGEYVLEKRIVMPHGQNSVYVRYGLLEGDDVRLKIRPLVRYRGHDEPVTEILPENYAVRAFDDRYEISDDSDLSPLRLLLHGEDKAFTFESKTLGERHYRLEQHRGYAYKGAVWTPGYFRARLSAKGEATLVATTESWETVDVLPSETAFAAEAERRARLLSLPPAEAQRGLAAELVLAADSFIVSPVCRAGESARARAAGEEARTIIAGYHWFTDWGRDTMISLEGLTLVTGRHADARYILRTFAHVIRDGLIPNLFPEGKEEGLYQTADASLWFFHAVSRYVEASGDRKTLQALLPRLSDVIDHHLRGTRFGIGVDDRDGLLRQGADSYPLTWMDAKVGDWVVTPRRGKAVEINALWYNALRLLQGWLSEVGETREAERIGLAAERTYRSFNERFWYEEGRYLYDVVDGEAGDDSALRPNQLLAISLSHPVLEKRRWQSVLQIVKSHLLTPVGLRSLAPGHADYKREYFGDLTARDAAYHQGTVWAWLLGPFIDAWLKLHPDEREGARALLAGFDRHLEEAGMGSVSEIFDAEPPFTPRGCIAQAWSVAEVLRCWVKTSSSASS